MKASFLIISITMVILSSCGTKKVAYDPYYSLGPKGKGKRLAKVEQKSKTADSARVITNQKNLEDSNLVTSTVAVSNVKSSKKEALLLNKGVRSKSENYKTKKFAEVQSRNLNRKEKQSLKRRTKQSELSPGKKVLIICSGVMITIGTVVFVALVYGFLSSLPSLSWA